MLFLKRLGCVHCRSRSLLLRVRDEICGSCYDMWAGKTVGDGETEAGSVKSKVVFRAAKKEDLSSFVARYFHLLIMYVL